MLAANVKKTIERFHMLSPGDRIVVAVSGGPDSVCLLSVLHALAEELDLILHIAHLDHLFRGKESADEALFVAALAKKMGIPATIEKIDVPAFCHEQGLSSQEGARIARYEFLNTVAKSIKASRIATGHTADDQAETLIMRLLRGAGVSGLSAIPPIRGAVVRPLIEITRAEVLEYLKEAGLEFKTDPSNIKPVYTRNRIRMDILPVLKQFNPRIVETLAAEAALLREENEAVEIYLESISSGVINTNKNEIALIRGRFNALPRAFRRRLLRKAAAMAGEGPDLSLTQTDEALDFMTTASTGRALHLPCGLMLVREYDTFVLSQPTPSSSLSRALILPGVTRVPELGIQIDTMIVGPDADTRTAGNYLWQAVFDYDRIGPDLIIRIRKRGDRFFPAGMAGKSKKLQDYFVDRKIPQRKRDSTPLLVSGDDILWVIGHRTDGRFLPGPETKKVLFIGIKERTEETHHSR
jgi:tRNA(Ile)-lysidine synthase